MNIQLEKLNDEESMNDENSAKLKRINFTTVTAIIILFITAICIICFWKKEKGKNFIHIIIDVSKSLKEPYENLILKRDEFNYNTLLKNIEFYSYFDRVNLIANIIGTKRGKFFDLIGLLTKLDSITNEDDINAKINNYENQEIYKCNKPDSKIINIYYEKIPKIKDILKSFSHNKKCVLLYYVKKNNHIKTKVQDNFEKQVEIYESYSWFKLIFGGYNYEFPEKEIEDKIRTDMINLMLKEKLKFEDYKEKNTIYTMSDIYNAIKSINNKLIKYQKDDITINNIIDLFQDYTEGETNLEEALNNTKNVIKNQANNYENKIVLMITDGKTNSVKSLQKISQEIKNEKNTYIIVIFISSKDLNRPGELFNSSLDCFTDYEKDLFEATSSIDSKSIFFLRNKNLTIPEQIKLFIPGQDKTLMNEILVSFKNFIDNNELLLFSIGKERLNQYLGDEINSFKPKTQNGGTCYAYASATAIHWTLLGFYGESPDSFEQIKNNLINKYGVKGNVTQNVLIEQSKKYKYKIKQVDENGARQALNNYHICVATYDLTELEWSKFNMFFYEFNKTGILTKQLLEKTPPDYEKIKNLSDEELKNLTGHAVILISAKNGYLRFLNSWGEDFGDHGFFAIDNPDTLRNMSFYEVYIDEKDLTKNERNKHEKFKKELSVKYFNNLDNYNKLCEEKVICPYCGKNIKIKDFKGNFDTVQCPKCYKSYETKDEKIIQKLFFDFINK